MRSDRELNDLMEFEHVICVRDGEVSDDPIPNEREFWAPELYWQGDSHMFDGGEHWTLLEGFSGQYSYNGPIMHASEYIGGRLEDYILENDGYYVGLVCDDIDNLEECAGWAVAYRPLEECRKCVAERERPYGCRACSDCEGGPDDDEILDRSYPWRPGFIGS